MKQHRCDQFDVLFDLMHRPAGTYAQSKRHRCDGKWPHAPRQRQRAEMSVDRPNCEQSRAAVGGAEKYVEIEVFESDVGNARPLA